MANGHEIPTWAQGLAAAGTFLGACLAAIKWRKTPAPPEKDTDMQAALKRLENHEGRIRELEREREETRDVLVRIFDKLEKVGNGVARLEGAAGIRRNGP